MSRLIKQGINQCGQACTAMILGITLEESIKLYGVNGVTNLKMTTDVLKKFKKVHKIVKVDNRLKNRFNFTNISLLRLRFRQKSIGHNVVYFDGKILDPEGHVFNDLNECLRYYKERQDSCFVSHYINIEDK